MTGRPLLAPTIGRVREAVHDERAAGRRIVLVPTMGALHEGHLGLVRRARELGDFVVVSIFVNPLQFGPSEDLDRYPRTLDADVAVLDGLADVVFAPSAAEMYPDGPPATRVVAGPVAATLEGASRPGHFDGVLTVVAKLLGIVQPDTVVFGRKDAQQIFLVRRMVHDLDLPVEVVAVDTVRAGDGLALSSRNRFLAGDDRRAALDPVTSPRMRPSPPRATVRRGHCSPPRDAVLAAEPAVRVDYLAAVDPATFIPVPDDELGDAARAGRRDRSAPTRLIDNAPHPRPSPPAAPA